MKKYRLASLIPLVLLAALFLTPSAIPPARAAIIGTVCIADGSSTTCPSSPLTFTGSTGTQLTVAVNIQGSDTFNGIDIHVKTDPTVLNPVRVDTETNSVLAAHSQFGLDWFGCLNGTPTNSSTGNVCVSGLDGPGVVRIVAVALGGNGVPASATGRLFSITYNIVSGGTSATIAFPTAPPGTGGCDPSSVQGTTTCVQVVFTSTFDPETVETASFNVGPPPPPPPTFSLSASPNSLTVKGESSQTSTITLQSVNGFTGSITLSTAVSPIVKDGLSATLSQTSVSLTANGQATSALTATAKGSTPKGTYTVTITASGGGTTKQAQVIVTVTAG